MYILPQVNHTRTMYVDVILFKGGFVTLTCDIKNLMISKGRLSAPASYLKINSRPIDPDEII